MKYLPKKGSFSTVKITANNWAETKPETSCLAVPDVALWLLHIYTFLNMNLICHIEKWIKWLTALILIDFFQLIFFMKQKISTVFLQCEHVHNKGYIMLNVLSLNVSVVCFMCLNCLICVILY